MFEKLNAAEEKYTELEKMIGDPELFADQEKFTKLMKEYKQLSPVISKFREYKKAENELSECNALLSESNDEDMREMASEEIKALKESLKYFCFRATRTMTGTL